MTAFSVETWIEAPIEKCFDLARSQSAHIKTTFWTRERIVKGPTHDLLELGDEVTFEGRHLGVRQKFTSVVDEFDRPTWFVDRMVRGAFHSFWHEHRFVPSGTRTQMVETVRFEAPGGPLGVVVERLFLSGYLQRFIQDRAEALKAMAESSP